MRRIERLPLVRPIASSSAPDCGAQRQLEADALAAQLVGRRFDLRGAFGGEPVREGEERGLRSTARRRVPAGRRTSAARSPRNPR